MVFGPVAGPASPSIAVKGLLEEEALPLLDEPEYFLAQCCGPAGRNPHRLG